MKISIDSGGMQTGGLGLQDKFGNDVANMGDLNGDGIVDIAVGTPLDDDGDGGQGAVYILFMNAANTVDSFQKISETAGNFSGDLFKQDQFGYTVAADDINGDGRKELFVGARLDDDGGTGNTESCLLYTSPSPRD